MGFNDFLTKIFGNKSQKDMREIKPWIDKIKAASPEIEQLDNDALRAKTQEIRRYIQDASIEKRAKIDELKAKIEVTELEDREPIFAQIDKIEKEILDLYEEKLNEVLPQVFAIVKETAKRFSENEEIVVTATDFDRDLAASHDFVRIEDDKAIYQNHWMAGGNEVTWNMVPVPSRIPQMVRNLPCSRYLTCPSPSAITAVPTWFYAVSVVRIW